jgi:hypothetical protein
LHLVDAQRPSVRPHELRGIVERCPQVDVVVEATYLPVASSDKLMEQRCLASLARSVQHKHAQATQVLGRASVDLAADLVLGCNHFTTVASRRLFGLQTPDASYSKSLSLPLLNP